MGFVAESFVAGLVASVACGMGALPLMIRGLDPEKRVGLGYAFAGGLMVAASVYNLLLPAFTLGPDQATRLMPVVKILVGMYLGSASIWMLQRWLTPQRMASGWFQSIGGRVSTLVFISMTFHSIPEGVAVGVGYGAEGHSPEFTGLGLTIALAISIHNIPEGLAVSLPMRAEGASIGRCFLFSFMSSLTQPIASVPAALMVWFFEPLMLPLLGFAAGAMMYLVVVELIPDALQTRSATQTAWAFMTGFGLMTLVQVVI